MRAGEVQPTNAGEERETRSSEPHRMDTRRGPGRLYSHIFQRSSAGRWEKACWKCVLDSKIGIGKNLCGTLKTYKSSLMMCLGNLIHHVRDEA